MTRAEQLEEIATLARACRAAQRTYLTRRDRDSRLEAKAQERMLDNALGEALAWLTRTETPGGGRAE